MFDVHACFFSDSIPEGCGNGEGYISSSFRSLCAEVNCFGQGYSTSSHVCLTFPLRTSFSRWPCLSTTHGYRDEMHRLICFVLCLSNEFSGDYPSQPSISQVHQSCYTPTEPVIEMGKQNKLPLLIFTVAGCSLLTNPREATKTSISDVASGMMIIRFCFSSRIEFDYLLWSASVVIFCKQWPPVSFECSDRDRFVFVQDENHSCARATSMTRWFDRSPLLSVVVHTSSVKQPERERGGEKEERC